MILKNLPTFLASAALCSSLLLLSGCAGMAGQGKPLALYDLSLAAEHGKGAGSPVVSGDTVLPILLEGIHAPTWLDNSSMQYRLAYAGPERRYAFAESRWVAPPSELIESVLVRNQVVRRGRGEGQACQLRLELDEFVQRFETAANSQSVLEIRATLVRRRELLPLAGQTFRYTSEAGADARGGVAAHAAMVARLSTELARWLEKTVSPDGRLARECRPEKL